MPYYNRDGKRDHNFDNHPYDSYAGFASNKSGSGAQHIGFSAVLGFQGSSFPSREVWSSAICFPLISLEVALRAI